MPLVLPGCWGKHKLDSDPTAQAAETVRITVVGDPALAEAIGRLKAEWHAVTGNTLLVAEVESLDPAAETGTESDKPDALVIPATDLGIWVDADQLVPVPLDVRASPQAFWSDMFLLVQQGAVWGEDVWAVPFGRRN